MENNLSAILSDLVASSKLFSEYLLEESDVSYYEMLLYQIVERTSSSLDSLFQLHDEQFKHFTSIGLICRTIINDFIIANTIEYFASSNEEYKEFLLANLYLKDLERLHKNLERIKNHIDKDGPVLDQFINSPSEQGSINNLRDYIRRSKERYQVGFFKIDLTNISELAEAFDKNCNDEKLKHDVCSAYNLWSRFSKYEHIGLWSHEFTRGEYLQFVEQELLQSLYFSCVLLKKSSTILNRVDFKIIFSKIEDRYFKV